MSEQLQDHRLTLAPYATLAVDTRGRLVNEPRSMTRSEFQRDRDRIIHSGAFRKLRNKTQVFIESEGDYYRTRLTHSMEVAQISRSICRTLGLDEDLAEALALAHDLGHTCFGHAGEEALAEEMKPFGGFSHNDQTFRILTKLECHHARFDGLNLTWETLDGIIKHNGPVKTTDMPPTIRAFCSEWDMETDLYPGPEAQIAALSDDIAYNTHDMDDGFRAGFFTFDDIRNLPIFGPALVGMQSRFPGVSADRQFSETVREVIGLMIHDLVETTRTNLKKLNPQTVRDIRMATFPVVAFSFEMTKNLVELRKFLWARMYRHTHVERACSRARHIVRNLFRFYMDEPECLPTQFINAIKTRQGDEVHKARMVADYIAGMTDRYAVKEHRDLLSTEIML